MRFCAQPILCIFYLLLVVADSARGATRVCVCECMCCDMQINRAKSFISTYTHPRVCVPPRIVPNIDLKYLHKMVGMNDASANALKWQMKFVKVRLVGTRVHGYATSNHCFFLLVVGACACFTLCTTSPPTHTHSHIREKCN